ncbi:MAG: alpha-ketoacid dehydrogenase subunit beta [Chloroflexi bacterium]|nr:alpha-ketoacid dehydrogenase subunit beta [Chloroflexota bacterium]
MPIKTMIEAIRDALDAEMQNDPRVFVLGEDVGVKGGVFLATDGLYKKYGMKRVLDTPLNEIGIAGIAIGAAMRGLRPVAEMQFADYSLPAFDQIANEAATIRWRTAGEFSCPLVVRAPYGAGVHGALWHSQSVEALYAHRPGLKVVIPSTAYDAKGLLIAAIRDPDPVIFFEHKKGYRLIKDEVPDGDYTVPIGKARIAREGDAMTVVSYGLMLHYCLEAAQAEGIDAEVLDLRTISPLDRAAIVGSVKKTGKCLVVTEDTQSFSITGEIAAIVNEDAFEYLDGPVSRLATPDVPGMPHDPGQEEWLLPNREKIAEAMRKLARY